MKKLVFLVLGILLFGFMSIVYAQNAAQLQQDASAGEKTTAIKEIQNKIKAGDYVSEKGEKIQIQEKTNNRIQLRVRNISAHSDLNITQEKVQNKTKLKVNLSNGRNAEIKIMPNTASETALARLRLKVCSEERNCTIELKEVGKDNETRVAYEIQTERHYKLLAMFRIKAQNKAQIDAETGEIIVVKKPWWAFLASEVDEIEEPEETSE